MTETNPKIATIRALLSKAEDPATSPEEAEAYFGKAADLMAKYGIEKALLSEAKPGSDKITGRQIEIKGKYIADRSALLFSISHALGAQNVYWRVYDRETGKYYRLVKIYAHESTLERIEMLFASLQLQAFNGLKQGRPRYGESTVSYRKSWLAGFASAVRKRLDQAEEAALQEASREIGGASTELVLVKREAAVEQFFKRAHPKIKAAPRRRLTGSGWLDGKAAGERADLGQKRMGGARLAVTA
jgi:hypothetical protein